MFVDRSQIILAAMHSLAGMRAVRASWLGSQQRAVYSSKTGNDSEFVPSRVAARTTHAPTDPRTHAPHPRTHTPTHPHTHPPTQASWDEPNILLRTLTPLDEAVAGSAPPEAYRTGLARKPYHLRRALKLPQHREGAEIIFDPLYNKVRAMGTPVQDRMDMRAFCRAHPSLMENATASAW